MKLFHIALGLAAASSLFASPSISAPNRPDNPAAALSLERQESQANSDHNRNDNGADKGEKNGNENGNRCHNRGNNRDNDGNGNGPKGCPASP